MISSARTMTAASSRTRDLTIRLRASAAAHLESLERDCPPPFPTSPRHQPPTPVRCFRGGLRDWPDRAAQPRIVVHDVEAAELLYRAIDRALDSFLAGDVGELKHRVAAVLFAVPHRSFAALAIKIGDNDRGAF